MESSADPSAALGMTVVALGMTAEVRILALDQIYVMVLGKVVEPVLELLGTDQKYY